MYWKADSIISKKNWLFFLFSDACENSYFGKSSDKKILPVLVDAQKYNSAFDRRQLSYQNDYKIDRNEFEGMNSDIRSLYSSIFKKYSCLCGAEREPGYYELIEKLMVDCKCRYGRSIYWITGSGARLRSGGGFDRGVIANLKKGTLVIKTGQSGECIAVRVLNNISSGEEFVFTDLTGYIHSSLVASYYQDWKFTPTIVKPNKLERLPWQL